MRPQSPQVSAAMQRYVTEPLSDPQQQPLRHSRQSDDLPPSGGPIRPPALPEAGFAAAPVDEQEEFDYDSKGCSGSCQTSTSSSMVSSARNRQPQGHYIAAECGGVTSAASTDEESSEISSCEEEDATRDGEEESAERVDAAEDDDEDEISEDDLSPSSSSKQSSSSSSTASSVESYEEEVSESASASVGVIGDHFASDQFTAGYHPHMLTTAPAAAADESVRQQALTRPVAFRSTAVALSTATAALTEDEASDASSAYATEDEENDSSNEEVVDGAVDDDEKEADSFPAEEDEERNVVAVRQRPPDEFDGNGQDDDEAFDDDEESASSSTASGEEEPSAEEDPSVEEAGAVVSSISDVISGRIIGSGSPELRRQTTKLEAEDDTLMDAAASQQEALTQPLPVGDATYYDQAPVVVTMLPLTAADLLAPPPAEESRFSSPGHRDGQSFVAVPPLQQPPVSAYMRMAATPAGRPVYSGFSSIHTAAGILASPTAHRTSKTSPAEWNAAGPMVASPPLRLQPLVAAQRSFTSGPASGISHRTSATGEATISAAWNTHYPSSRGLAPTGELRRTTAITSGSLQPFTKQPFSMQRQQPAGSTRIGPLAPAHATPHQFSLNATTPVGLLGMKPSSDGPENISSWQSPSIMPLPQSASSFQTKSGQLQPSSEPRFRVSTIPLKDGDWTMSTFDAAAASGSTGLRRGSESTPAKQQLLHSRPEAGYSFSGAALSEGAAPGGTSTSAGAAHPAQEVTRVLPVLASPFGSGGGTWQHVSPQHQQPPKTSLYPLPSRAGGPGLQHQVPPQQTSFQATSSPQQTLQRVSQPIAPFQMAALPQQLQQFRQSPPAVLSERSSQHSPAPRRQQQSQHAADQQQLQTPAIQTTSTFGPAPVMGTMNSPQQRQFEQFGLPPQQPQVHPHSRVQPAALVPLSQGASTTPPGVSYSPAGPSTAPLFASRQLHVPTSGGFVAYPTTTTAYPGGMVQSMQQMPRSVNITPQQQPPVLRASTSLPAATGPMGPTSPMQQSPTVQKQSTMTPKGGRSSRRRAHHHRRHHKHAAASVSKTMTEQQQQSPVSIFSAAWWRRK